MKKSIYHFSKKSSDGDLSMKNILGGKGANLANMCKLGLNVPAGFTISSEECLKYLEVKKISENLKNEILSSVKKLELETKKNFGKSENTLLVSIRSGAAVSMPGMMDTVLNLGLNKEIVENLVKNNPQNERFYLDSYRRFIQMYGSVVLDIPSHKFETILNDIKNENDYQFDHEINPKDLNEIIEYYLSIISGYLDLKEFFDPYYQLFTTIEAVFKSWNTERAILYRELNNIDRKLGTAVNVQSMVFGNVDDQSGSGVLFSRNPSTGENVIYGEYLQNCQGEDVVAGTRTPFPMLKTSYSKGNSMEEAFPEICKELCDIAKMLEKTNKDVQDIEFTIEKGQLFILQTRTAKRTASGTLKSISDMIDEKILSEEEGLLKIDAGIFDKLIHSSIDDIKKYKIIAKGLAASPGCVSGEVCFSVERCVENVKKHNKDIILVRNETTPEDLAAMNLAKGILTANGGTTSHAAVVARGMGKPCITACPIKIDEESMQFSTKDGIILKEGDIITIEGSTGDIILGKVNTVSNQIDDSFKKIINLAKKHSKLEVYSNSDTSSDIKNAISFGSNKIGLCRTEHMFFENQKINAFRKLILADENDNKDSILNEIFKIQKEDFKNIFESMDRNGSVNIRLLDPPLHEFLPHDDEAIRSFSDFNKLDFDSIKYKIHTLKEMNPMLGNRGMRLGILRPEIYDIQVKSIIQAFDEIDNENIPELELMVPFVNSELELSSISEKMRLNLEAFKSKKKNFQYKLGVMIELPRACIIADKLAKYVDYFSFGTNDLTQTTLGISRDDCALMISEYIKKDIYQNDPFMELDEEGVGYLMTLAINKARTIKPNFKVGICGEHGANRNAIRFSVDNKINYVSCSPFRIPKATIIAAQESLK